MIRLDQPWRDEAAAPQREARPGSRVEAPGYRGSGKLQGFGTLVTGGDSSLGRAVALLFAREGADVALCYLASPEEADATRRCVEAEGTRCLLLKGDVGDELWCRRAVQRTVAAFGRLDVLVNNPAGGPLPQPPPAAPKRHVPHSHISELAEGLDELDDPNWLPSAEMPVAAYLRMARSVLPYLRRGGCIINTGLANGPGGAAHLLDQAAMAGAVQALTRSLAASLLPRGIRVNAIVPGQVWPAPPAEATTADAPVADPRAAAKRAAQPEELSPAYVFLAAPACSASISGLVLPIEGGTEQPR